MGETGKKVVAEFIGTFALVFIGAGAICTNAMFKGQVGLIGVAFAHGLVLAVMISALGHISGGHINPAVTAGFLVTGKMRWEECCYYAISQLLGGVVAAFFLRAIFPLASWQEAKLGATLLGSGVGPWTGTFVELILTFFLVTAVFGTAVDPRHPPIGGFGIGLVLTFDILMGGPLTGASMNPARSFGPALVGGYWAAHWVYWLGPLVGGILAALVYEKLFMGKR
ncbi:MAG: MIP/aquaporin family protein [Nitrospinota bacterium]